MVVLIAVPLILLRYTDLFSAPSPPALVSLEESDPRASWDAIEAAPKYPNPNGGGQYGGLVSALVDNSFNTGLIPAKTGVRPELISLGYASRIGFRNILLRVPEGALDSFVRKLRRMDGVRDAGQSGWLDLHTAR